MIMMDRLLVISLALLGSGCNAFSSGKMQSQRQTSEIAMLSEKADSRRSFLSEVATTLAFVGSLNVVMPPEAALAVSGANKVNAKLRAYGLDPITVPDGFSTLLEIWGKGKNKSRFPLLVNFAYPLTWIVTLPSNDVNGEDGTIQAGEYAKGDTATLYVNLDAGGVDDVTKAPKELFETTLQRAIGQKGNNMFQNFKITKLEPAPYNSGKQNYMIADFKYQLLTGAGFEVDRKGVASITSAGPAVEVLWSASTAIRYKKTESQLRQIVASFRCYADGLNLSDEMLMYDEA